MIRFSQLYRKRAETRLKQAQKKKMIIQQQNNKPKPVSHRVLPDEVKTSTNNNVTSKTIEDVIKIRKEAEDKAAKRRKEKARLARIQAIEELKNERNLKKEKLTINSARSEVLPDQPKKYKLAQSQQNKPLMSARFDVKIGKNRDKIPKASVDAKTSVSVTKNSIDAKSVLSHGKSETLDAILDSLKELEAGAEAVVKSEIKKDEPSKNNNNLEPENSEDKGKFIIYFIK